MQVCDGVGDWRPVLLVFSLSGAQVIQGEGINRACLIRREMRDICYWPCMCPR